MPDSIAVKMYRDQFRKNLSTGRRRDIDVTVKDLNLWGQVLKNWGYHKNGKWVAFNPLSIEHLLSEYERLERKNAKVQ